MKNHKEALSNPAAIVDGERIICDNCNEKFLFHMRDNHHEFTVGMTTFLHCLHLAEKEGMLPKLPSEWWIAAEVFYAIKRELL